MKLNNRTKNSSTLKQLKTQLTKKQGELDGIKIDMVTRQKEYESKKRIIDELQIKITRLEKPTKPEVSEHAILRYVERVLNVDIEHIKKEILSEEVLDMVTELGGNGGYPNKIGYKVVMKDNVVVTIVK